MLSCLAKNGKHKTPLGGTGLSLSARPCHCGRGFFLRLTCPCGQLSPPPPQDEARNGRGKRAHIGDLSLASVTTQNAKNQLLCDFARALSLSVYGHICTRCRGSVFPYNTAFLPLATEKFYPAPLFYKPVCNEKMKSDELKIQRCLNKKQALFPKKLLPFCAKKIITAKLPRPLLHYRR